MPKQPKAKARTPAERGTIVAGVNFNIETWTLLHKVAFARALRYGGRPSVSKILGQLVEKHRKELEKELSD